MRSFITLGIITGKNHITLKNEFKGLRFTPFNTTGVSSYIIGLRDVYF